MKKGVMEIGRKLPISRNHMALRRVLCELYSLRIEFPKGSPRKRTWSNEALIARAT